MACKAKQSQANNRANVIWVESSVVEQIRSINCVLNKYTIYVYRCPFFCECESFAVSKRKHARAQVMSLHRLYATKSVRDFFHESTQMTHRRLR